MKRMNKVLVKAVVLSLIMGGVHMGDFCLKGYAAPYNGFEIKTDQTDSSSGVEITDPEIFHKNYDWSNGHDDDADCGESAGNLTVGQIAEIKDKLVENDKNLAKKVNEINGKIENGELKGESAYESAVAGGYEGSKEQFYEDLATDENTYVDNENHNII